VTLIEKLWDETITKKGQSTGKTQDLTPERLNHNALICGCFVASADKQSDNSALLLQLASIVAHCYN